MELIIDSVTKKFKDKVAVKDFSVELNSGVYGLLGPNGSGKTTLMRMLADVISPTEGTIKFNGRNKDELKEEYRALIGYLPQDIGFYKNFTAEKFLNYVAALKGVEKQVAREKIDELLDFVNLEKDRKRKIGKFSGGMKQRLGIAQALLNDPKILILDEPTAGLDPNERIRFKNLIASISKDKIVILSTHIVSDIEFIANDVLIMKEGQLIEKAKPQQLMKKVSGSVWNCHIDESELYEIEKSYKVANISRDNSAITVRVISETKPEFNCTSEEPNLEDVFLYYFKEITVRKG